MTFGEQSVLTYTCTQLAGALENVKLCGQDSG
jgi:hypothetical protein